MAVLVEGISVIVRMDAVVERFPMSWYGFQQSVPNSTLCCDGEIARVGFMTPEDTEDYVRGLESAGLTFLAGNKAVDLAVADQQFGITTQCDWLQFGKVTVGIGGPTVSACRLVGSKIMKVFTPPGWVYEKSLSYSFGFVPLGQLHRALQFLYERDGLEVYLDPLRGKKVFIGRTSRRPHRPRRGTSNKDNGRFVETQLRINSSMNSSSKLPS